MYVRKQTSQPLRPVGRVLGVEEATFGGATLTPNLEATLDWASESTGAKTRIHTSSDEQQKNVKAGRSH